MHHKRLIIFMPSINGGGVEKNFFILSEYFSKKINDVSVITISKKIKHKLNKKIKLISPKYNFWDTLGRRKKFIISIFLLFLEILKDRRLIVFCLQLPRYKFYLFVSPSFSMLNALPFFYIPYDENKGYI